jgi:hypothetical protein
MKKNSRIYWTLALYLIFTVLYLLFFILKIDNFPLFIILTISSVTVLSSSTIYTISRSTINHKSPAPKIKLSPKKKTLGKFTSELIEDYFEAMPIIDQYGDSETPYEEVSRIDEYIFTEFNTEDLIKIDRLKLSKMDKIFFLREMLYFEPNERKYLIDEMIKSQEDPNIPVSFTPLITPFGIEDKLRIYSRSLIEPGEKTKIIIIEKSDFISEVKLKIGTLFDYNLDDFVLSSGGILLDEKLQINHYNIEDDDEIAIIPSRKERK